MEGEGQGGGQFNGHVGGQVNKERMVILLRLPVSWEGEWSCYGDGQFK